MRQPEADSLLRQHLAGARFRPPWRALGVLKPPKIDGRPLNLRFIFEKAHAHGGYEGTTEAKRWASIATGMGLDCRHITNAGWLVRTHYLRFLMPIEEAMREEGIYEGAVPLPKMSEEAKRAAKRASTSVSTLARKEVP